MSSMYPYQESRKAAAKWRHILLMPLLLSGIAGCNAGAASEQAAATAKLVESSRRSLLPVKGGEFQMGDFGEIHSEEKLPYTGEANAQPLHKVRLADFFMLKWRVTNDEYNVFAAQKNMRKVNDPKADPTSERIAALKDSGRFPALVTWDEAQAYCGWLGQQLGKKMQLPTEAQWEYAARDGGKFYIFATNDGSFREGDNVLSSDQIEAMSQDPFFPVPVGSTPANSLGLGDFAKNGYEWVSDWYGEDYYAHSAVNDPAGPSSGLLRVVRSVPNSNPRPALTMQRTARRADGIDEKMTKLWKESGFKPPVAGYSFRCAGLAQ